MPIATAVCGLGRSQLFARLRLVQTRDARPTAAELICQFVVLNPLFRTENGEPFSAWKSGDHPDIPGRDEAGSNRARRWAHLLR